MTSPSSQFRWISKKCHLTLWMKKVKGEEKKGPLEVSFWTRMVMWPRKPAMAQLPQTTHSRHSLSCWVLLTIPEPWEKQRQSQRCRDAHTHRVISCVTRICHIHSQMIFFKYKHKRSRINKLASHTHTHRILKNVKHPVYVRYYQLYIFLPPLCFSCLPHVLQVGEAEKFPIMFPSIHPPLAPGWPYSSPSTSVISFLFSI